MSEQNEANTLIDQIESLVTSLRDKPLDNVQLDLLEVASHLLANITFQVAKSCAKPGVEPVEPVHVVLQPGEKCEVNFSREDGPHSDYWQLATVTDVKHLEISPVQIQYKTTATTDWINEKLVRRPVEKK